MSDIELPVPKPKHAPLDGRRERERIGPDARAEADKPWTAGHGDLSVGSFFAEHKALVDGRRAPLQRLGMDPAHVTALTMPTLDDKPQVLGRPAVAFPVEAVEFEDQPLEGALPRKLPKEIEEAL